MVVQVIDVVETWQAHFASVGVSPGDLQSLAERIDDGELLSQRQNFRPQAYVGQVTKRKPTSPFRRV